MAYALEIITPIDREKIVEDAKQHPMKERDLTYAAKNLRDFPQKWAVDRERDLYMYFAPILVRLETMAMSLYFFFQGALYEIRVETPFGSQVNIVESPPDLLRDEFEKELSKAFTVFGRSGEGQKDYFGNPDPFVPEFKSSLLRS
jgi:hypothetical protein